MTDELKQWEYDRGYAKGKADAFEECISLLEKYHIRGDLIKDLEWLKEQKGAEQ